MAKILLIGEPLALLVATTEGPLEDVEDFKRKLAGAEVNVAIGLARLGHTVHFVSKLGNDPYGAYAMKVLEKEGINTDLVTFTDEGFTGSILKGKVSDGDPPVAFFCAKSAATTITPETIENIDLSEFDFIHITGVFPSISKTCLNTTKLLMKKARDIGIPLSFDPNLRPVLWGNHDLMVKATNELSCLADIVMPGLAEGKILTGFDKPGEIADFYSNLGIPAVIVKLGEDGAYIRDNGKSKTVPGFKVDEVIDTVGAGDGFATGVVSAIIEGLAIEEAVVRANAIGAMQIMHISDNEALPTRPELYGFMNGRQGNGKL